MTHARLLIAAIIALIVWTPDASAQTTRRHDVFGRYQQLHWEERDGLPQNTVLAITMTRDGYLWLGTYEGAARFDGVRFTLFSPSTTTGIGNSMVTSFLERHDGTLWLGTYGGGVSRFSDGQFTQYDMRRGLSSDMITCLFEDRAGTLWIGTDGGGVNAFSQGRVMTYSTAQGLPADLVTAIVDDGNGGVVVGTSRGIARISNGRVSAYEGPAHADVVRTDIKTLARSLDGSLWVAPMSGGLYRLGSGGVTTFGPDQGLTSDRVVSLFADEDGRMWAGTSHDGLFRASAAAAVPASIAAVRFERYAPVDGLPGARVAAIARGVDRGLWVGTNGGLVRFHQPRVKVYTEQDGLAGDFIGGIFQDAEGSVWAETDRRLTRFTNGVFTIPTAKDGLPDGRIIVGASNADRLPLVLTPSGVVRWARDRFVPATEAQGIPWERVNVVIEDRARTLWFGTHGAGVIRVRGGHATRLTEKDGLADDSVESLFEDRRGNIWVGTLRKGMTRIAASNGDPAGRMTSWSTADGLPSNHVKVFHEDASGTLWIGTHGGGLSRFKNGRFATISARQGLYNDQIFQILEDDDGNFWMNCNTGIWRNSVEQLNEVADGQRRAVESFVYNTADGMLSSEGVGATLAGWKMRDGSLWFPTTKGIVVIDPRRRDTEPPRVMIEGITIDREIVPLGGRIGEPLRLTPSHENIEIHYTGLNWSRPQAIKFRYRLVGLDRDWVDAGTRRTAYYSHLPAGAYTFTVIADNGDGVWTATGKTLPIVVLPRLYETAWFRAAAVAGLVALVWTAWRYRMAAMRRGQAAQQAFSRQLIESEERERQRIAAELHDSLGQNLLVVKNRALLGALAQPDSEARKQFDEIGATVAQTLAEVRTIAYNLRPHHLEQLGLTTTIRAMVEKSAESSGIVMIADLDDLDGVFPPEQEITIYRIIQESVNNVIKHANAREARIAVRSYEDHVEITVQDDGQGFAPMKATTAKATASAPNGGAAAGGFGLKGLAERVQMLGGTYTIDSAPGRGTTVTVRIGTGRIDAGARRGHRAWRSTSAS